MRACYPPELRRKPGFTSYLIPRRAESGLRQGPIGPATRLHCISSTYSLPSLTAHILRLSASGAGFPLRHGVSTDHPTGDELGQVALLLPVGVLGHFARRPVTYLDGPINDFDLIPYCATSASATICSIGESSMLPILHMMESVKIFEQLGVVVPPLWLVVEQALAVLYAPRFLPAAPHIVLFVIAEVLVMLVDRTDWNNLKRLLEELRSRADRVLGERRH